MDYVADFPSVPFKTAYFKKKYPEAIKANKQLSFQFINTQTPPRLFKLSYG